MDEIGIDEFEARGRDDRHQFRFIVSPEDASDLCDLRSFTRQLMSRVEADLSTRLDWIAVDHWNTDNPHTHIVLRGKDEAGKDLVISGEYIARGIRTRGSEIATAWLGPRSDLEIRQSLTREIEQERWTSLDRALKRNLEGGSINVNRLATTSGAPPTHLILLGRLRTLERMGLAENDGSGEWRLHADTEAILRTMGERHDIVRSMQRAMGRVQREIAVQLPSERQDIVGRVLAKGMTDELSDRKFLCVDGVDGKAHYVPLNSADDIDAFPVGALVDVRTTAAGRQIDKSIAALAQNGIFRTSQVAVTGASHHRHSLTHLVQLHVRRLEALRRAGLVERLADGVWRVPNDLPRQGIKYDFNRHSGSVAEIRSRTPIEQQTRAIAATWLDEQLIDSGRGIAEGGFGLDVRAALRERAEFLIKEGLAERREGRLALSRNLLSTLRTRELTEASKAISEKTGLAYRAAEDGRVVSGRYRRNVDLVSGRFAMLIEGQAFSLVPWKRVIDKHLGKHLAATVRGRDASWELGRQRGISLD